MSNFLAIATVTAVLQRMLQAALDADMPGARVTTVRPDGAGNNQLPNTGANLYLYQVTPNAAWRNADLPTRTPDGRLVQRPRLPLDLDYLISFYGAEADLEPQRILGSVARTLHSRPVLTRSAIDATLADPAYDFLAGSNLADEIETVKLNPLPLTLEEHSKLWSVFFQTAYSLSVAYQASVVLLEAEDRPQPVLPVQTRNIFVVPSLEGSALPALAPDRLSGLELWLRSDSGVTFDAQGVSAWVDGSANGFVVEQADTERRPSFVAHGVGQRPALRFDGVDDCLAIRSMSYSGALTGLTVCALARSSSPQRQIILSFDRDEYWHLAFDDDADEELNGAWDTTSAVGESHLLQSSTRLSDNHWHLLCGWFGAGGTPDKRLFVDGVELSSANAHEGESVGSGATRFGYIGVGSQASVFDGEIGLERFLAGDLAELVVIHRAISDEERQGLERYFARRYGQ